MKTSKRKKGKKQKGKWTLTDENKQTYEDEIYHIHGSRCDVNLQNQII